MTGSFRDIAVVGLNFNSELSHYTVQRYCDKSIMGGFKMFKRSQMHPFWFVTIAVEDAGLPP